ncbi:Vascular endothelial growth factor receptor 3 [Armadillidium vulgare]|nr:Vascular endothelial growth factor receptor 3 [Armadillidium vulgare]
MHMNEKYKPDFKWILPNINAISDLKEFRNRSLFSSILIIKNAYLSDSGQYVCRVSVLNRFESSTTKDIEIHERLKTEFSEIPSFVPPDKNITITLFITQSHFNESQPNVKTKLEKEIGPFNRYKAVFSIRPSTSGKLWCDVWSGGDFSTIKTYLNVSGKAFPFTCFNGCFRLLKLETLSKYKMAPFMVTVRTENAFVNLTPPGTLETIKATEGDNISIACFALGSLYYYNSFTSSGKTSICDTKLSLGNCLNIVNISLREDWFFECIAQTQITNIIEKISFRIHVDEKIAPWVQPNSSVSLNGTKILVKSLSPLFIACYVEGRPKPKITWLKDGENIVEIIENNVEVSLRDDNQILEFKNATTKYAGKYECSIENRVGRIQPFTNVIIFEDEDLTYFEKNLRNFIVSFTIIVIISFSIVIFLAIKIKKNKNMRNDMLQFELFLFQEGKAAKLNKECTIEEQAELLPYDHSYEVERENITLGKQLGTGAFGRVLMAQVKGLNGKESPTRVAIKMCKYEGDKTHIRALILELKIMIHLGKHLNIVNLIGAHTSNIDKGELWILVEYCRYGNLLKFIQKAKSKFINQIDPVTSDIDVGRTSPFPNDPLSPKSLGCSIG